MRNGHFYGALYRDCLTKDTPIEMPIERPTKLIGKMSTSNYKDFRLKKLEIIESIDTKIEFKIADLFLIYMCDLSISSLSNTKKSLCALLVNILLTDNNLFMRCSVFTFCTWECLQVSLKKIYNYCMEIFFKGTNKRYIYTQSVISNKREYFLNFYKR